MFATIAVSSYLYNYNLSDSGWSGVTSVSGFCCLPVYFLIAWNNFDWAIFRRLWQELSTFLPVLFAGLNWLVDVLTPTDDFSPFFGFVVFYLTCVVVTMDCIRVIKRSTILFLFGLFAFLMLSNIVGNLGVDKSADKKVFTFAGHIQYKSKVKRSLFSQIFTLTLAGLWQAIKDWKEDPSSWLYHAMKKAPECLRVGKTTEAEGKKKKYPHGPYLLHTLEPIKEGRVAGARIRITYKSEGGGQVFEGVLAYNMKKKTDIATVMLDQRIQPFAGCCMIFTPLAEIVFEKAGEIKDLESGLAEMRKRREYAQFNEEEILHIENFRWVNEKEHFLFITRRKRQTGKAKKKGKAKKGRERSETILFVATGEGNNTPELKYIIDENKDENFEANTEVGKKLPPDTRIRPLFKPGKGVIQISHGWLWNKKVYRANLEVDGSIRFNETANAKEADKLWENPQVFAEYIYKQHYHDGMVDKAVSHHRVDAHKHIVYVEEIVAKDRCFRRARKLGDYISKTVPKPHQITIGTEATAFCGTIAACLYVINSIIFKDRSETLNQITQICGLSSIVIFYMTNIIICSNGRWVCCRKPNIDYTQSYQYEISNVKWDSVKLLCRELKVVIVMLCALLNWIIDIMRPATKFSPINGFVFMFIVWMFIFFDACKYRSNTTVMVVGMIFSAVLLNNLIGNVFAGDDEGVVVFYYQGQPLYKRSLKYNFYQQIFILGQSGFRNAFLNLRHGRSDSLFTTEVVKKHTEHRLHVIDVKRKWRGDILRTKKKKTLLE